MRVVLRTILVSGDASLDRCPIAHAGSSSKRRYTYGNRSQYALGELTGIPAATKVGVEKALAHALKHGTACEKADAIILAAEWAHAHNELKEHK